LLACWFGSGLGYGGTDSYERGAWPAVTQPADTHRQDQAPEPVPMSPALRELIRLLARAAVRKEMQQPRPGAELHAARSRAQVRVLPLDQLRGLPSSDGAGIYFLWLAGRLQYIGTSVGMLRRTNEHLLSATTRGPGGELIPYTRATMLLVPDPVRYELEALYIRRYAPPFNRAGGRRRKPRKRQP
jgi:hypothetical protein